MGEKYDETLAKLNIIESDKCWQNLVNTDIQRSILFPDNYHESRFDNKEIPFHTLKYKFVGDYDVAFKHLNEQYGLLIVDYKLYHPYLLKMMYLLNIIKKYIVILMFENQKVF